MPATEEKTTKTPAPVAEADNTTEETVAEVKAKSKKKTKKNVPAGQVHIKATFNNTIVSVTDKNGNLLTSSSAGACGFRGSKKGTAYAAQIASEKALSTAKQNHGVSRVDVYVSGIGLGRDAAVRALLGVEVMVDSITETTSVPHGGCRPKKSKKG